MPTLNSYGGTFVGLRSVLEKSNNGNDCRVVTVKLGTLKQLSLPKLEKPCKREFFVTVVFDTDSLEETMEHQRNRSVIRLGEFENGYYTCCFNEHSITLPCKGKSYVRLYLSCISTIEENNERKIVLNGLSYSEAYKISKSENYREDKSLTLVSDAAIAVKSNGNNTTMVKQGITGGILSFKIETKPSLGIYIPRDVVNSVLDAYKSEGEVYYKTNSNKFDLNKLNSLSNKGVNANGELVSERNIKFSDVKKMFDKKCDSKNEQKVEKVKSVEVEKKNKTPEPVKTKVDVSEPKNVEHKAEVVESVEGKVEEKEESLVRNEEENGKPEEPVNSV